MAAALEAWAEVNPAIAPTVSELTFDPNAAMSSVESAVICVELRTAACAVERAAMSSVFRSAMDAVVSDAICLVVRDEMIDVTAKAPGCLTR